MYLYVGWGFGKLNEMMIIIEQIELQAKLLNYFLGSNKSNINQFVLLLFLFVLFCFDLFWFFPPFSPSFVDSFFGFEDPT